MAPVLDPVRFADLAGFAERRLPRGFPDFPSLRQSACRRPRADEAGGRAFAGAGWRSPGRPCRPTFARRATLRAIFRAALPCLPRARRTPASGDRLPDRLLRAAPARFARTLALNFRRPFLARPDDLVTFRRRATRRHRFDPALSGAQRSGRRRAAPLSRTRRHRGRAAAGRGADPLAARSRRTVHGAGAGFGKRRTS